MTQHTGSSVRLSGPRNTSSQSSGPQEDADPWMAAMRRGDFTRAWQISDDHLAGRLARNEPKHHGPRHLQCIWDGGSLVGKRVLVRCYHGLGDTIQFIRFAAPLRRLAREVIVWAQPPLTGLIATAAGVDEVLPLHDGTPDVAFDADIEIMELAHALRVDHRAIACEVPYLFPPFGKRRVQNSNLLSVGLVWRAGDWDQRRSIHAGALRPLGDVWGVRLFSMQCGAAAQEAASIPAKPIGREDILETAASLHSLDLLISVDTFLAHLAGALGVPVWLLLHAQCDWRWLERGDRSVWYPTMRLFRQTHAGEWKPVIDHVATELRILRRHACVM